MPSGRPKGRPHCPCFPWNPLRKSGFLMVSNSIDAHLCSLQQKRTWWENVTGLREGSGNGQKHVWRAGLGSSDRRVARPGERRPVSSSLRGDSHLNDSPTKAAERRGNLPPLTHTTSQAIKNLKAAGCSERRRQAVHAPSRQPGQTREERGK